MEVMKNHNIRGRHSLLELIQGRTGIRRVLNPSLCSELKVLRQALCTNLTNQTTTIRPATQSITAERQGVDSETFRCASARGWGGLMTCDVVD